jgi:hypothetical protein
MKNEGVGVACHSSFIYSYFLVIQWAAPPSISHHQTQNAPLGKPILDTPPKKKAWFKTFQGGALPATSW